MPLLAHLAASSRFSRRGLTLDFGVLEAPLLLLRSQKTPGASLFVNLTPIASRASRTLLRVEAQPQRV
jgi:hypothetical protein